MKNATVCDRHQWPYGVDVEGACLPMCVWCEALRADALEQRVLTLRNALLKIYHFPVHSEPVGGAYAMQDIAHDALNTLGNL